MYSMDFKTKIFDACQAGESCRQVSIRFAVSCTFVARMMKRYRETGSFVVLEKGKRGPRFRLSQKQLDRLGKIVEEKPGLNARQFRDKLGVKVSILTVWRALRRMGLTVKKNSIPG